MQTNNFSIQDGASELLKANNILLLCHKNPDGDTIGSAAALMHALKSIGKTCNMLCSHEIPQRYDYMQFSNFKNEFEPGYIVAIDTASTALLGDLPQEIISNINMCIDHHPSNTNYAHYTLLNESAAATAELMYGFIIALGAQITPLIADCLYTGLATDTGCFRFANTSASSHEVAHKLINEGARLVELNALLFESKSRGRIELERAAYRSLEFYENDVIAIISLSLSQINDCKAEPIDLEGITAIPRSIENVQAGITIRQISEHTFKVSLRTTGQINAASVCKTLGGGGHAQAAGCEITGTPEKVKNAVLKEVISAMNK